MSLRGLGELPADFLNIINQFFTNIGPKLDSQIPPSFDPVSDRPQIRTLHFEPTITVENVTEYLKDSRS